MIAEKLSYAAIFLGEAITAWLYFSYIYTQTRSRLYTLISFALGYTFLFLASQFDAVLINIVLFFAVNTLELFLNFSCGIKSSVLHSAFLTLMVGITEILVNLFITCPDRRYPAGS